MYMDVSELTPEEMQELKENYFYDILEENDSRFTIPEDIPDAIILEHYKHVAFVKEDFWCNI